MTPQDPQLSVTELLLPQASDAATPWVQSITDVTAVIVALCTALILLSGYLVKLRQRLTPLQRMFKRHDRVEAFLEHVTDTAESLVGYVKSAQAMRGLLLRAENCEFLKPQNPVRISILSETAFDGIPRVRKRWQNWGADDSYLKLLHSVVKDAQEDRGVLVETSSLEDGDLRDYYVETGVVASVVFFVGITFDHEMLYVSLNFGEPRKIEEDEHGNDKLADLPPGVVEKHLARARHLHASPERVRRKARHIRSLWSKYLV